MYVVVDLLAFADRDLEAISERHRVIELCALHARVAGDHRPVLVDPVDEDLDVGRDVLTATSLDDVFGS